MERHTKPPPQQIGAGDVLGAARSAPTPRAPRGLEVQQTGRNGHSVLCSGELLKNNRPEMTTD